VGEAFLGAYAGESAVDFQTSSFVIRNMSRLPVTIRTVAERAGVSVMTVSRVLRNHASVAEATREKVLRAVEETGYRPNPLVGAWMAHMRSSSGRQAGQQTIAYLTTDEEREAVQRSLTLRAYFEGARARAEQLGFKLEPFWLGEKGMTGQRMSAILQTRGIAGVLVAPLPVPGATIDLQWDRFASVVFGYSMREPNLHRVTNHQIHSMRLALAETARLGYRRIGLALAHSKDARVDHNWTTGILPYHMSVPARQRVQPFLPQEMTSVVFGYSMREPNLHRVTNHQIHSMRLALAETARLGYRRIGLALAHSKDARVDHNWTTGILPYQMSVPARQRVQPFLPQEMTRESLLAWVDKERPEVILGGRQDMVVWLREAGLRVPEEIGFVSLEYYPDYGDLAGVDQNSFTIGLAAVELVVEQLYHNERGIPQRPKVVMIESCWHPGKSVRRVRDENSYPAPAPFPQSNP